MAIDGFIISYRDKGSAGPNRGHRLAYVNPSDDDGVLLSFLGTGSAEHWVCAGIDETNGIVYAYPADHLSTIAFRKYNLATGALIAEVSKPGSNNSRTNSCIFDQDEGVVYLAVPNAIYKLSSSGVELAQVAYTPDCVTPLTFLASSRTELFILRRDGSVTTFSRWEKDLSAQIASYDWPATAGGRENPPAPMMYYAGEIYVNHIYSDPAMAYISVFDTVAAFQRELAAEGTWPGPEWSIETIDSAGWVGEHTSLAWDINDFPHISYYDHDNQNLKYASWNGIAWTIQTPDSAGDVGSYNCLDLDSLGRPHIAYLNATNSKLKYTKWNGTEWVIETVDTPPPGEQLGLSKIGLKLDSQDRPRIVFYETHAGGRLRYVKWSGTEWIWSTIESGGSIGRYPAIEIDNNDVPHVAYQGNETDQNLKHAWWNDETETWVIEVVDTGGAGAPVLGYTSIARHGSDLHVAYGKGGDQFHLYYASNATGSWTTSVLDSWMGFGDIALYSSIAVDLAGYAHISYSVATYGYLRYVRQDATGWLEPETLESSVLYGFWHTSIGLDSNGRPHISYFATEDLDLRLAKFTIPIYRTVLDFDREGNLYVERWEGADGDWAHAIDRSTGAIVERYFTNPAGEESPPQRYIDPRVYPPVTDYGDPEEPPGGGEGGGSGGKTIPQRPPRSSQIARRPAAAGRPAPAAGSAAAPGGRRPSAPALRPAPAAGHLQVYQNGGLVYSGPERGFSPMGALPAPAPPLIEIPADVRLYGSDGLRKRLPQQQIESISWDLIEQGYFGTATITFRDDFDAGNIDADGNDRLEIWLDGTLRYRGYIGTPEQQLDIPEKKVLTAYGLAERLNKIKVDKRYVWPGGTDISQAFAKIAMDFILPRISPLELDIQSVGYNVENLALNVMAREAFGSLIDQAARRAVWGFDVDASGNNRIFLRPKGTDVNYKFAIGGRVQSYNYPPDYSQIVNTVHVIGAEAKYPNLIANSSFEFPKQADANDGNLITDGSFEADNYLDYWTESGGASRKGDYVRTGSNCMCLDALHGPGERIQQNDRNIVAGKGYTLEYWHKAPENATYHVEIQPDGGNPLIRFPAAGSYSVPGVGIGGAYSAGRCQFTAPAGCTKCSVAVENDDASYNGGFRIDDVALWLTDGIVQEGWQSLKDSGVTALVDWAYEADRKHGAYAVRLQASAGDWTGKGVWIIQTEAAAISIKEEKAYQCSFWLYAADAIPAGKCAVSMWVNKSSGAGRWEDVTYASEISAGWNHLWLGAPGWTSEADDSTVRVGIKFMDDVDVLIDGVYFQEINSDDATPPEFVPGKNLEFDLDTDDSFVQSDPNTPNEVKNSISTYGVREANESVEGLADLTQAQNWALGYFGIHAQPVIAHGLELVDWEDEIAPDGLVELLDTSLAPAFPVLIKYNIGGDGMVKVSLDLNTERPTFEGLLARVLQEAKAGIRSQAASSASAASPGGSGGSSGGGHAQSHALADSSGLGADHTTSGLTTDHVLQATGTTTARFQALVIPSGAVGAAQLATDAVETAKIKDGNVTAGKLADQSVTLGDASDGSLAGKIDGRYQVYTTNATPDTEDTIAHGLGRTPAGFVVVSLDKPGIVYKGSTAWDSTNIYLKCSAASAAVTLLIF